jgi:hypothetical protein
MSGYTATSLEFAEKFRDLVADQAEWSQATFGSDQTRGPSGALKHLEKEAREAQLAPYDESEYADCFLLILDAARRAGIKPMQLVEAAQEKMKVNRSRTWPTPNQWKIGDPHFVDSEDCMGNRFAYWRVFADRDDVNIVGQGTTAEQATDDCLRKIRSIGDEPVEHLVRGQ